MYTTIEPSERLAVPKILAIHTCIQFVHVSQPLIHTVAQIVQILILAWFIFNATCSFCNSALTPGLYLMLHVAFVTVH